MKSSISTYQMDCCAKNVGPINLLNGNQKEYEIRHPTHDLKMAAIVFALRFRRHYLYGKMCISYTDYKSLKYIFKGVKCKTKKAVGIDKGQ